MKKAGIVFLLVILFLFSVVPTYAVDFDAAVGDIIMPFRVSDQWKISTPDQIDPVLCDKQSLPEAQVREFMYAFHYCVWFVCAKNEASMIVRCEDISGVADYGKMSAEKLNAEITKEAEKIRQTEIFEISKIEKYNSGNILFVKYTIRLDNEVYAIYFETVSGGKYYEIRFFPGGKMTEKMQNDLQSVVDSVGVALTFPESYSKAPATTVFSGQTAFPSVEIDLDQQGQDGVLDITAQTTLNDADDASAPEEMQENPDMVEIGTDGYTVLIEESVPSGDNSLQSAKNAKAAAVAVGAAVVLLAAVVVVLHAKKKKVRSE